MIKEQVREQILSGELKENDRLPSLRRLAADLKISVLTTTRAYSELEEEGYITSRQGKGFFVMSSSSELLREQLIKEVERKSGKSHRGGPQSLYDRGRCDPPAPASHGGK